jgi:serine/threonine protein phosphatase PrpC
MATQLIVNIGGYSSAGIKSENEDAINYSIPDNNSIESKGIISVLADGVSSSEEAKQASNLAVKNFIEDYYSTPDTWSTKKSCQQVIGAINSWLYKQGSSHASELKGWVTTFDALILKSTSIHIIHIGDSRVYRLRNGILEQLTQDHITWINSERSYLSRALGADSVLQIDFKTIEIQEEDIYLQTSDGVHDFISTAEIIKILSTEQTTEEKAKRLVEKAIAQQSNDNLSAQVINILKLPNATKQEVYNKLSELPFPPELQPGMKIDGFEILQEINLSPRSQIYLAKDSENGQELILKTPSVNYSDDPWYLDGFVREEWIGQRLKHPGLMKTYQTKRAKKFLYFTTEMIKGQNLAQWIIENPSPEIGRVRDYVEQIASALRSMHRQDIIHQDLKPDNIMIDENNRTKIIDFGAVNAAGLAEISSVLQRQQPEGTVNYTAPEYLMGEKGSKRSDIFSLSVITYELLTGHLPFKEKKFNKFQLKNYQQMKYISLLQYRTDLPQWLNQVLKKGCSPDPSKRYSLLSEFTHELKTPKETSSLYSQEPLLKRNPLVFWQGLSLILFVLLIIAIIN